jgi:hypothetical protein
MVSMNESNAAMTTTEATLAASATWTFRLRIRLHKTNQLRLSGAEQAIAGGQGLNIISVAGWPKAMAIENAEWLVFAGTAPDHDSAWEGGRLLVGRLLRTFARLGIAAELGPELLGPSSDFVSKMIALVGRPLLDDLPGLMVYPTVPPPMFSVVGGVDLIQGHAPWRFEQTLHAAGRTLEPPTDRERLAFDLFGASRFENSASARLFTLVMAVEAMLSPPDRSAAASAHVRRLIAMTEDEQSLATSERASLLGSLRWLEKESITKAGRLLMAERLPARHYGDQSAEQVWAKAYDLRSGLAHGRHVIRTDVDYCAAQMFQIVGDLLSGSLLDFEPQSPSA